MKTILIIGAYSGIAVEFAKEAIQKGYSLILSGRDMDKLEISASDISIRTKTEKPSIIYFDALKTETHNNFIKEVLAISELHGVFIASGVMYDQSDCEKNFDLCKSTIESNYLGLVSIINLLADYFETKKNGFISCITSIAGDRGRLSNYIYGSSKAALSVYLEGLRGRLFESNVLVQTIKPGPIDTEMTKGLSKLPLLASPEKVACDILKGIEKNKEVVYTPGIWRYIMAIICIIPVKIYKRLKL
ncbi:MAG: short-chain dehydrogenase/reductase SDR [uncultured bacterium]|nr:MAG: short-chain dehydrogenase/reductase SDR [uncultured bacterium]